MLNAIVTKAVYAGKSSRQQKKHLQPFQGTVFGRQSQFSGYCTNQSRKASFIIPSMNPLTEEYLQYFESQNEGKEESLATWFFHAHVCCDHKDENQVDKCIKFRDVMKEKWKDNKHVSIHTLILKQHSLFPVGQFEVLFSRDVYTDFLTWIQYNVPEELPTLIHPISRDPVADHTTRAIWIGSKVALDESVLKNFERKLEEMEATKIYAVLRVYKVGDYPEDIIRE